MPPKPPERRLSLLFMDIHKMMHKRMRRRCESLGLQFGYNRILFELAHGGLSNQNEIAAATNLSFPTVSVALQNMEKDGLVTRTPDEHDRRKICVQITEKGREVDREVGKTVRENDELFLQNVTPEEQELLTALLQKIHDTFEKEADACVQKNPR